MKNCNIQAKKKLLEDEKENFIQSCLSNKPTKK